MKNFKNFKTSTDLTPVQQDLKESFNIEFCEDENGIDWYHCRAFFSPDTLKVTYDTNGRIIAASTDVTMLRPVNLSVAEISLSDVPPGFDAVQGEWLFSQGEIIPVPVDAVAVATQQRDSEMTATTLRITALTQAQEDDDITLDEETELAALREYRTSLRRLDLSVAPDIDWPVAPVL
ncbi:tail fiber assembly protein [Buttiauxella gaviniae]|uniref:tail fiber assembly protein n=1 Tax=Buttiauxella gaviniae TaxID=82990 RepID=UPI003C74E8A9